MMPRRKSPVKDASAETWSASEVCSWLEGLKLQQYAEAVLENEVDGEILLDLIEKEGLVDLGVENRWVDTPSHRSSWLAAVI